MLTHRKYDGFGVCCMVLLVYKLHNKVEQYWLGDSNKGLQYLAIFELKIYIYNML